MQDACGMPGLIMVQKGAKAAYSGKSGTFGHFRHKWP
jgi:hypothetical protein